MSHRNLSFLQGITDDDTNLLCKILDWAEAAEEKYLTKFSFFLDERQCGLCTQTLASVKCENYKLWGGYEDAERKILCVYPPYGEVSCEDFPMKAVTFNYRQEDKLSHRDFLGAIMALQIKRECVGDILVGHGSTSVFVKDTAVADVLSLQKIGRVGVKTSEDVDRLIVPQKEFKEIMDKQGMQDKYDAKKMYDFYKSASYSDDSWERIYELMKLLA